jgi:hypothetical protein
MSSQAHADDSRFSDRELLGVLAERVGGMRETFDDFRAETRNNFDANKTAVAELKTEMKADAHAIRQEMRETFEKHEGRIGALERDRDTTSGGIAAGKWLWGAALAAIGLVAGWLGKSQ